MTHDQTTPASVEVRDTRLTRPIVGIKNRTAQEVFDIMCDRIAHSAPDTPKPEPVLRWEDDPAGVPNMLTLYLGEHKFGAAWETKHTWRTARTDEWCSSEQEAKEAEEQAVRDWIIRAGLYTHPAPPADLVELLEALRNCLATGLPEEVASAARAALRQHIERNTHAE